jgi:hypothetical protein
MRRLDTLAQEQNAVQAHARIALSSVALVLLYTGARSGFANYSQAMKTAGITWDEQTLAASSPTLRASCRTTT